MKYLQKYKIFESGSYLVEEDKWEDLKDLIQMEIMDKWGISNDLVSESIPGRRGNKLLEPELHMRINERFDNDEPKEIMKDCRDLHKRIFNQLGLYVDVKWSSQQVNIMLNDIPNHYTVIRDFNLEEIEDDNTYDRKGGGVCDWNTSLNIIKYLNGFYRFAYDSDINLFNKCYDIVDDLYGVELVFSLPQFKKELYRQILSFKFKLSTGKEKVIGRYYPIFMIATNHIESPLLRKRGSNSSWITIYGEKRMLDFLATEQF
jgi:hypothetical protein